MISEVSAVKFRQNLGEMLNRVQYRHDGTEWGTPAEWSAQVLERLNCSCKLPQSKSNSPFASGDQNKENEFRPMMSVTVIENPV